VKDKIAGFIRVGGGRSFVLWQALVERGNVNANWGPREIGGQFDAGKDWIGRV